MFKMLLYYCPLLCDRRVVDIGLLDDYAKHMALPHVRAFLYQLHEGLTCGVEWTKASSRRSPAEVLTAAALNNSQLPFYVQSSTDGEALLAEYAWRISSDYSKIEQKGQPGQIGYVRLEASVSVALDIFRGTPEYLSTDGSVPGFLCRAERLVLQDSSLCYRLVTSAGALWLRQRSKEGLAATFYRHDPPHTGVPTVVHLAETICYRQCFSYALSGPWTNFQTRDESGRVWRTSTTTLKFSATCGLGPGRYAERIRKEPVTVLNPPYEAIWQPNGHDAGLPLDLVVSRL